MQPTPAVRRRAFGLGRQLRAWIAAIVVGLSVITPAAGEVPVREVLRERIEQLRTGRETRIAGVTLAARTLLSDFYEARAFEPAWDDPARRAAMIEAARDSAHHGLDPADYGLESLAARTGETGTPAQQADRDLLYTEALVRLAYHYRFGKVDPREMYRDWNYSRTLGTLDPRVALQALIAAPDLKAAVESYAPRLPAYRQLRSALRRYREIEATGGWPRIGAGPSLKPGMRDARVATMRTRLDAEDHAPLVTPDDPDRFDPALSDALAAFQRQHGLEADGVAGRRTVDVLDVGVARRIEQIRVNLERLRWVATDLGEDFLFVDIAGFEAWLTRSGREVWRSPVVVGRPYRRTPSFRSTLRYLVINPSWVVPPTVLREDVLPKVAKDPAYLDRHGIRALDASGHAVPAREVVARGATLQFVQPPGPDNPLGRLKFMMPNPYSVYLHDTPSRSLFDRSERAFSSGCIRLARPRELAVQLLDDASTWNPTALDAAIATGETRTVWLKRPVEVMLLYFTARADETGRVSFRPDLYDRDGQVAAALGQAFRFRPVERVRAIAGQPSDRPVPATGGR